MRTQGLKATQEDRLLEAGIEIIARDGYAQGTVAKIVAAAGVSRPTFYEYFADKDACLLAVLTTINRELLSLTAQAVEQAESSCAALGATEAIVDFCHCKPAAARVWLIECLAGAPPTLAARDDGIDALARLIDEADRKAPPDALLPDISSRALLGGIHRLLGSYARQGESLTEVQPGLLQWIESYFVRRDAHRWDRLPTQSSPPADPTSEPPFGAGPGGINTAYPYQDPDKRHRDRIFFAAAQLLAEKRLDEIALADIAKHAGIGYRRLTALFGDKERIFSGLHELGYLRTFAATSAGYFSRDAWPERVWAAGEAYTHYVGGNAALARVGFLLPYGAGPRCARQMDEILKAFTLFLHEGYSCLPSGHDRPSEVALEAIAATIFEMGYRVVRGGNSAQLPGMLPQAVFVALAPFLGVEAAVGFVEGKVGTVEAGDG